MSWGARAALLILDDFAMRDFTVGQADDLYELVSERAGRSIVITANRSAEDWYSLFPNPSWPSRSSTGWSTGRTTCTCRGAATGPTAGPAGDRPSHDRLRRCRLRQPRASTPGTRASGHLLLARMPADGVPTRHRRRGRAPRREP